MIALLLSLTVSAAPAQKLALPGFTGVKVAPELLDFSAEHFAGALRKQNLTVITQKEIAAVLGLERQKQLLGCADGDSSCTAELAGALGVEGTVMGSIARLDDVFQLHLKIVAASDGRVLAEHAATAMNERDLLPRLEEAAATLAAQFRPPVVHSARWYSWIPAAAGVALAGAATAFWFDANAAHLELVATTGASLSNEASAGLVARGERSQLLSRLGFGIGAAAVVGAVVLFFVGAEPAATPTVVLDSSGAGVAVTVRLPATL
ncbi:MAG: hypothetical protein GQE15_03540 [Archangiaceae bacterium]|nr:hypothetical protein [Archangiaceae bacterium]